MPALWSARRGVQDRPQKEDQRTGYRNDSRRKAHPQSSKGLWKCAGCKKQFTVTVGTIFEDSHIPLHKWLLAIHLLTSSKKGMSAHQLMRNLDIKQYKSAWFMAHRIRYAMTGELPEQLNGVVEADETYIGGRVRKHVSHATKPGQRAQDATNPFGNNKRSSLLSSAAAKSTRATLKRSRLRTSQK
jgi:transposase-like protein